METSTEAIPVIALTDLTYCDNRDDCNSTKPTSKKNLRHAGKTNTAAQNKMHLGLLKIVYYYFV